MSSYENSTSEEKVNFEKWAKQLDKLDEDKYNKKAEELELLSQEIIDLKAELEKANETIRLQAEKIKSLESKLN